MIFAVARRLDQLVDDMGGRGLIRIAHPEIDNILAAVTRLQLERLDLRKNVGRKTVYAIKTLHVYLTNCLKTLVEPTVLGKRSGKRINCNAA